MRDIGESENEIPQELGRADRAMRQASRELKNGDQIKLQMHREEQQKCFKGL